MARTNTVKSHRQPNCSPHQLWSNPSGLRYCPHTSYSTLLVPFQFRRLMTPFQRDKAWEIHPRPYIGQLRFLDLTLSESPSYPDILARLKNDPEAKFLDLGCCFGQDIRKLVYDGAPAPSLYGAELRREFVELGFDCFRDRDKIAATVSATLADRRKK